MTKIYIDAVEEYCVRNISNHGLSNLCSLSSHDWPDKAVITILRGVCDAMKPSSRVLIRSSPFVIISDELINRTIVEEFVLQRADRVSKADSAFKQAPEPLLPNYGVGRIRQYALDLDMMVMANSQERRLEEFIKLAEEAGLNFVKLWDFGEMGAVELRLPPKSPTHLSSL